MSAAQGHELHGANIFLLILFLLHTLASPGAAPAHPAQTPLAALSWLPPSDVTDHADDIISILPAPPPERLGVLLPSKVTSQGPPLAGDVICHAGLRCHRLPPSPQVPPEWDVAGSHSTARAELGHEGSRSLGERQGTPKTWRESQIHPWC